MDKDNIKIQGHVGKWHVIDKKEHRGKTVYLLEHNTYGDMAAGLIIDKNLNVFWMMSGTGFLIWMKAENDWRKMIWLE